MINAVYEDSPFEKVAAEYNPYTNKKNATILLKVMSKLYDFANHCSDLEHPLGDKDDIKAQIESLREDIKSIHNDLKDMIPKEATKKKESAALRFYRQNPIPVILFVHGTVHELGKYLDPHYPEDKGWKKEEDIKRYWKDTYKKPYSERIYMDSRSKVTIAISIIAYQWGCPFRKLYDIYNKANEQRIRLLGKPLRKPYDFHGTANEPWKVWIRSLEQPLEESRIQWALRQWVLSRRRSLKGKI